MRKLNMDGVYIEVRHSGSDPYYLASALTTSGVQSAVGTSVKSAVTELLRILRVNTVRIGG